MAILKSHPIYDHMQKKFKATPLSYWRYAGVIRFENLQEPHSITGMVAVIRLDGYLNSESRAAAKASNLGADFSHEFLIANWKEKTQETRPATVEEKKAARPDLLTKLTEDGWAELQYDIVISEQEIEHNDYTRFMAAYNTPEEGAVVYDILKTTGLHKEFFDGALDV